VGPLLAIVAVPVLVNVVIAVIGFAAGSNALRLLLNVLSFVVSTVATYGIVNAALIVTAGQPLDFGKAFQNDRWGEWFVFSIVFGLIIGIGFLLCIIPGFIALAFFGLAPFFFVDRRMSLGDSLSASRQAAGEKGLYFPIILCVIVGALGFIACFVGVFVTEPIAYIAVAFLYRYAVGQSVAA
jgi:uncharacterized membrane protein